MYRCSNCKAHFPNARDGRCPICGCSLDRHLADKKGVRLKDGVTMVQALDMKCDAEYRIMEAINREIRELRAELGAPVNSVAVDLVDISDADSDCREYAVQSVRMGLDITRG